MKISLEVLRFILKKKNEFRFLSRSRHRPLGVERCAGTLVNMRKPLCNLGKYLTSELHSVRVLLQALWIMITEKISSQVELTHKRREEFQIKWPVKSMQQTTCTAKDSIVSMAATMTSLLGAVSHLMQDVSLSNAHSSANVDARAHARYVMVLATTTNMLSAVILWPVYQAIVLQKFVACTATDVTYTILRVADAASNLLQYLIQSCARGGRRIVEVMCYEIRRAETCVD